jgi:hypothetical protein
VSDRDVYPDDMFDDDPVIEAFARDLRTAADASAPPTVGATLAAVLAGEAPATSYDDGVVVAFRPRRALTGVRVALAGAAAAALLAVLGTAGALPEPAQEQVADLASRIGISLPDGGDDDEPATTTTTSTTTTSTTSTTRPVPSSVVVPTTPAAPPATPTTIEDEGADDGHVGEGNSGPGGNGNGNGNNGNGRGEDTDEVEDEDEDEARDERGDDRDDGGRDTQDRGDRDGDGDDEDAGKAPTRRGVTVPPSTTTTVAS